MDVGSQPPFVIALLVAVPLLLLIIGILVAFVCCSKRYKLNWYEKTLLNREDGDIGVSSRLLGKGGTAQSSQATLFSTANSVGASHKGSFSGTPVLVPETIVEYVTVKGNMGNSYPSSPVSSEASDSENWTNAGQSKSKGPQSILTDTLSPWGAINQSMDSVSSEKRDSMSSQGRQDYSTLAPGDIPLGRSHSSIGPGQPFRRFSAGATPERPPPGVAGFPVPSTDVTPPGRKKRSASLIPQLPLPISSYLKSGASSKDSSANSLHELCPPLTESVSPVQLPGGQYHRRRRASMQDALDHTKFDASLYQHLDRPELKKQESVGSIPEDAQLGSMHFCLTYDPEQSLLTVRLNQASGLVPRDFSGTADPYCRIRVMPHTRLQLQSKVQHKTLNPEWEEDFIFDLEPQEIPFQTLEILLYDFDQFSRDECIGQIQLPLSHVEVSPRPVLIWRAITPYDNQKEKTDIGEVMFSLAYLPSAERLTVVIMKARNLKTEDSKTGTTSKSANPFARITILSGNKKVKKKKTSTKRNTLSPVWNEAVVFSLSKDLIKDMQIELAIYNESLLGNHDDLGRVVIGPKSSGEELSHWNDVINSKSALARWHSLTQGDV